MNSDKPSSKIIKYVSNAIENGDLNIGDKLPPERELSEILGISRTSVREGVKLLESIGIITSRHGSGNYIDNYFNDTLVEILTLMYSLEHMSTDEIREFRYAVEYQALVLACRHITEDHKTELMEHLHILESSEEEEIQSYHDKMIHLSIIHMTGNRLVISNYMALNHILDLFISQARTHVRKLGSKDYEEFQQIHRQLVESLCSQDIATARAALKRHFDLILQGFDS